MPPWVVPVKYTLPSSSNSSEGSMPRCAIQAGSDHSPRMSSVCTMKLPPPVMLVVIM